MKPLRRLLTLFLACLFLPADGPAEENSEIDVHGYLSQGFMISNKNNFLADTERGTFQFNELGINFSTELTDKLRVGIQVAARDLGDLGNDKVIIDWAYADYRWRDWLGIRVGKIKLPIGFYNKTRDLDMLRIFILLPQGIYWEAYRDASTSMRGISAYGEIPLKGLGDISYQVLAGTKDIEKDGGTTKGVEGGTMVKVEKYDVGKTFFLAIIWETPLQGLRIGLSRENSQMKTYGALTADIIDPGGGPPQPIIIAEKGMPVTIDAPGITRTVYSIEYTWKNLVLAAEYRQDNFITTTGVPGLEPEEMEIVPESFYGSASCRFSDWFEAGIYYSLHYKDPNDRDGTKTPYDPFFRAFQKDTCLALRFDLNDHWIVKLEGHLMDGTGLCFALDNLNDNGVPGYDRKWFLLAAKMTFNF
jgi:hypothetical protein